MKDEKINPETEGLEPETSCCDGGCTKDACECGPEGCNCPPEGEEAPAPEAMDESDAAATEEAMDELMQWRDRAMRTAAEYDNYRKRCMKEREEFNRYATRGLLEELLPVIDNFEMGMQMAAQENTSSMIYIGMNMVQKQLHDFLDAQGAKPIEANVGDAFDHNIHEAIQSEVSADLPEGSIVRIIRPGYMLKDRLLRPVNVVPADDTQTCDAPA